MSRVWQCWGMPIAKSAAASTVARDFGPLWARSVQVNGLSALPHACMNCTPLSCWLPSVHSMWHAPVSSMEATQSVTRGFSKQQTISLRVAGLVCVLRTCAGPSGMPCGTWGTLGCGEQSIRSSASRRMRSTRCQCLRGSSCGGGCKRGQRQSATCASSEFRAEYWLLGSWKCAYVAMMYLSHTSR